MPTLLPAAIAQTGSHASRRVLRPRFAAQDTPTEPGYAGLSGCAGGGRLLSQGPWVRRHKVSSGGSMGGTLLSTW